MLFVFFMENISRVPDLFVSHCCQVLHDTAHIDMEQMFAGNAKICSMSESTVGIKTSQLAASGHRITQGVNI